MLCIIPKGNNLADFVLWNISPLLIGVGKRFLVAEFRDYREWGTAEF